jgi:predicted RNA binding protein YcfA (HicA-like mRNA interferase family)
VDATGVEASRVSEFPSMKAMALLRVLTSTPLNYQESRRSGSHRQPNATGRPSITWAFHGGRTLVPVDVRRVLVNQVGLDEREALRLL